MFLGETQIPKIQKLRVQKRIVFLPVGGGVGHFEKQTRSWKQSAILQLFGKCGLCVSLCLWNYIKSFVFCQVLAEALRKNSALTYLRLEREYIGDKGAQVWCLVRMVSRGAREWRNCKGRVKAPPFASDIGEMSKGAAMIANVPHFSSESQWLELVFLNLSWCIGLKSVMTTYDNWLGYWSDPGRRKTHINSIATLRVIHTCFQTQVALSCRNFKSGPRFGMASLSYGCWANWNGSC